MWAYTQHILADYSAWDASLCDLTAAIGSDLSFLAVGKSMVESKSQWNAVVSNCEQVMLVKETEEREQVRTATLPCHWQKSGRQRVRNDLRPPVVCGGRCEHICRDHSAGPGRSMSNLCVCLFEGLFGCDHPQPNRECPYPYFSPSERWIFFVKSCYDKKEIQAV